MKRITHIFLIAELILYIIFLSLDLTGNGGSSIIWKYIGIILCFIYSVYSSKHQGNRLIPIALLFTMIADYFLLVENSHYTFGLICFFIVQTIYMVLLIQECKSSLWPLRIILPITSIVVLYRIDMLSLVNVLAVTYFSWLLINTIIAWKNHQKVSLCFAIGLTLFACCDLCVGFFNISSMIPTGLYEFASVGMWLFYLPSQVLIVLSGRNKIVQEE